MKIKNQLEEVFLNVLSNESLSEIELNLKQHFFIKSDLSILSQLFELYLCNKIAIENDCLRFLTDEELFELGFLFGFEDKLNRWKMIEELGIWFSNNLDLFRSEKNGESLKDLSFEEVQSLCQIINIKFGGRDFFNSLENNKSIEEALLKLSLINIKIVEKAMKELNQNRESSEETQIELNLDEPKDMNELDVAYEILDVDKNFSNNEIKKSFFSKAKNYHPDRFSQDQLDKHDEALILDNFRSVKRAFEIIKESRPGPW